MLGEVLNLDDLNKELNDMINQDGIESIQNIPNAPKEIIEKQPEQEEEDENFDRR